MIDICMVPAAIHCLFYLPGYYTDMHEGSPTCINRTAANGGLADGLPYGHLMVQGEYRHTNACPLYSLSNEKVSPNWLLGV